MVREPAALESRSLKLLLLFALALLLTGAFLYSVAGTIRSDRHLPSRTAVIHDRALRGSIVSADGYTLALPRKIYKAVVYAPGIDPGKFELFVRLFSIYTKTPAKEIRRRFIDKKGELIQGYVTLARSLDAGTAVRLKSLAYTLRRLHVFRPVHTHRGVDIVYGLDIIESGENREFPLHDVLEPALGYVQKTDAKPYRKLQGIKGLERYYHAYLAPRQDGYVRGMRDVSGTILRNGTAQEVARIDGMTLHLNIRMSLQQRTEWILDRMREVTGAQEILAGVMESGTGKLLALASSRRFDPAHILQSDIPYLQPRFTEYTYEPGSVIKPLTLAIALAHNVVTPRTWFDLHGGRYQVSPKYTIRDDEAFDALTATDIIVHSSNIGISKIAWRLNGQIFHDGLTAFGLGQPSGIDLSNERHGSIKPAKLLEYKVHSGNQAYGYSMTVTFAQMLKAYSAFNNNGIAMTPRLVAYVEDTNGTRYHPVLRYPPLKAIQADVARELHAILKKVVAEGTGTRAQYPGLEIGGKTGTAHISKGASGYSHEYHSSFYGFANDTKGRRYTIGVLVIRPTIHAMHFASKSAAPVFRDIVDALVEEEMLTPDPDAIDRQKRRERERQRREQAARKQRERTRAIKARLKAQREAILRQQIERKRVQKRAPQHRRLPPATPPPTTTPPVQRGTTPTSTPARPRLPVPPEGYPDMF